MVTQKNQLEEIIYRYEYFTIPEKNQQIQKLQSELDLAKEILFEIGATTHKNEKLYKWYNENNKEEYNGNN